MSVIHQKLGAMRFYPYNGKIIDFQFNDTNKHTVDIGPLPQNTVMIIIRATRMSGSGWAVEVYPNFGATAVFMEHSGNETSSIPVTNHTIQLLEDTANDDWDIYCFGYFTQ